MCGIGGIVGLHRESTPLEGGTLARMCSAMHHRGPDDHAVDVQGRVGLAFTRLAIIDVEGGMQPLYNEDRTVRVICNGEIYNYRELRLSLKAIGHQFATDSDAEVLVHLWEEYGCELVNHLNGMFAFALHDMRSNCVVLARDHIGIKPLYYALADQNLVFGSEVKVILASGLVERSLDVDALGQFLSWEYVPGKATLIKAIRKIEPASLIKINLDDATIERTSYWDIASPTNSHMDSMAQWEDRVDQALRQSVRSQLVSDVPLGAFLSGGVDSSLIVASMDSPRTFSIGFDNPSYNELPWSNRVAQHLGSAHCVDVIRPNVVSLFDQLMHHMDDPIGDFSIFPTYLVSRHSRRAVTVALSGDGGDELFGGYETYIAQDRATAWRRIPALMRCAMIEPAVKMLPPTAQKKGFVNKAKRFVEGLEHGEQLGHARWRLFMGETMRRSLFTPEAQLQLLTPIEEHIADLYERAANRDACDRALYTDVRSYLVDNCLVKVDRMSMACSLEVRVPFLDPNIVNMAFAMPSNLKVRRGQIKMLLKRVAARHVPHECVYRPKEGFSIPIKNWLRDAFRPLMDELLDPMKIKAEGLFNPGVIERLKSEHLSNKSNHSHLLWGLLVFQDWRRRWAA